RPRSPPVLRRPSRGRRAPCPECGPACQRAGSSGCSSRSLRWSSGQPCAYRAFALALLSVELPGGPVPLPYREAVDLLATSPAAEVAVGVGGDASGVTHDP